MSGLRREKLESMLEEGTRNDIDSLAFRVKKKIELKYHAAVMVSITTAGVGVGDESKVICTSSNAEVISPRRFPGEWGVIAERN